MSIRAALETALNAMSPSLATAWENVPFEPPAPTTAYQRATILLAQPNNTSIGGTFQEIGILQVDLMYPQDTGADAAEDRAALLRTTFKRGTSFTASGITVTSERTPEIMPGRNEEGRFVIPVRIRFFAHIISA